MNNNYLILGLVLFFGILYYCFSSSLSVTENFQGQAVTSGQDDMNSINTLAQLATKLMSGGNTVPGNLTIQGNTTVGGDLNVNGTIGGAVIKKGTASPDWTKIQFGDGTGWRIRFQRNDANPVMDIYDNGALNTTGTISTSGYLFAGPTSSTNQVRVGELYGKSGVYSVNSELNLAASNSKVYIGSSNGITNDLTVTGKLQILDPIIRRNQIAGYFKVRARGYKVPLHYGFNMLWDDHNRTEKLRNNHNFPESQIHFYRGVEMREANNEDWRPRYLVVFPGYKIRIYFWRNEGFEAIAASYPAGEHIFPNNAFTEVAHGLQVRFEEESGEPQNRYQM